MSLNSRSIGVSQRRQEQAALARVCTPICSIGTAIVFQPAWVACRAVVDIAQSSALSDAQM